MGTSPVRPPSPQDQAWAALGLELTPAKSLARVDTASARVVATVTVVGALLTGFGVIGAGLPASAGPARILSICSVVAAILAIMCALAAQLASITRRLNPFNLTEVEAWYRHRLEIRAPLTQAATVLLLLAAAAAGTAAVGTLLQSRADQPTMAVTRTTQLPDPTASSAGSGGNSAAVATSTITVEVTFRGLDAGQVATVRIITRGRVLSEAAFTAGTDGAATRSLVADKVGIREHVTVDAVAGQQQCHATLASGLATAQLACPRPG